MLSRPFPFSFLPLNEFPNYYFLLFQHPSYLSSTHNESNPAPPSCPSFPICSLLTTRSRWVPRISLLRSHSLLVPPHTLITLPPLHSPPRRPPSHSSIESATKDEICIQTTSGECLCSVIGGIAIISFNHTFAGMNGSNERKKERKKTRKKERRDESKRDRKKERKKDRKKDRKRQIMASLDN